MINRHRTFQKVFVIEWKIDNQYQLWLSGLKTTNRKKK